MIPLPTELVRRRARGSIRLRSPAGVCRTKRYSSPGRAAATSADQVSALPPSSRASGLRAASQSLNVPTTATDSAWGAQTRKVEPDSWEVAPMPGRLEGVGGTLSKVHEPGALRQDAARDGRI